jgi:hypothetical protein
MKVNLRSMTPRPAKAGQPAKSAPPWLETQGKVMSCHYEFVRLHPFTLGILSPSGQFLISYTYHAHGTTFNDQFNSEVAVEQNETFPVLYNPLNPQQNNKSSAAYSRRAPIAAYGIAASIFCSLLFLVAARGCQ